MRYICQQNTGIILYVVTQSEEVASALCGLNGWLKIGPMEWMTNPTRANVMNGVSPLPENLLVAGKLRMDFKEPYNFD